MDCPDCVNLRAKREAKQRIYELAILQLTAAVASTDSAQYMILRVQAQQAQINRDRAETNLRDHLDRHAVPNLE